MSSLRSICEPITAPELDGSEAWLDRRRPLGSIQWSEININQGTAAIILALRSMRYEEYLQTQHWQAVRARAMKRARFICQICPNDAAEVHHQTYDRKGFERPEDVVALCRGCHETHHRTWGLRAREDFNNTP